MGRNEEERGKKVKEKGDKEEGRFKVRKRCNRERKIED